MKTPRFLPVLMMTTSLALLAACGPPPEAEELAEGEEVPEEVLLDNAHAKESEESRAAVRRNALATRFDGLGTPAGGCGVPQGVLDSQNFVALNVQNTPRFYGPGLPRPIADASKRGEYNNGKNCGRWVRVKIGSRCTGTANGVPDGSPTFCKNGKWVADPYNGATLDFVVADSCQDNNRWCRDDRYHLDMSSSSLGRFRKNGAVVSGLAQAWNNRQVSWEYIPAPNYSGDLRLGFRLDASPNWPALVLTHLPNGIHGVQAQVNGRWQGMKMNGDSGQVYELPRGRGPYRIRVIDAAGKLVHGGRVYEFSFPASCGSQCKNTYTAVRYTTR